MAWVCKVRPLSSHLRDQDRRRARAERALKQSFYAVSTCHFASSVSISIFLPSISPSCSSRRRMLSNVATFKGEEDQRRGECQMRISIEISSDIVTRDASISPATLHLTNSKLQSVLKMFVNFTECLKNTFIL